MTLGELQYKDEDFADCRYDRLAERANSLLCARLEKAPLVYGCGWGNDDWQWSSEKLSSGDDRVARVVCIEVTE